MRNIQFKLFQMHIKKWSNLRSVLAHDTPIIFIEYNNSGENILLELQEKFRKFR